MAFIPPKHLAHRVAETIAAGCAESGAIDPAEKPAILATAEAVLAQLHEEAAKEEKRYKLTPEGQRKVAIAALAGKVRLATFALADKLAGNPVQTETARKGTRLRKFSLSESVNELRQLLIQNGQDPRKYVPSDERTKVDGRTPGAVVTLAHAASLLKVQALLGTKPQQAAAKAG